MKKLLIILALVASAHAKPNNDWYVGFGFFSGEGELSASGGTSLFDSSGADIKFGVIFDTGNRFEFSALEVDVDYAGSTEVVKGRDFDWIFTGTLNNEKSIFLAFVSAGFGTYSSNLFDSDGYSAQAALGGYIRLYDVLEFEISYKEKVIAWGDSTSPAATSISHQMANYYFGAKYKF